MIFRNWGRHFPSLILYDLESFISKRSWLLISGSSFTLSSSLVLSLDQTLLHLSSRFDCILSFNFSLNLCNNTPVLSLEQRWPSGSVILMTSTSPFASRVEMLKGHLNHLQSAHLHFTSSGHSFCLWQIWIPFTISHFVPSWVESTSSTWTPLRSGIRST